MWLTEVLILRLVDEAVSFLRVLGWGWIEVPR